MFFLIFQKIKELDFGIRIMINKFENLFIINYNIKSIINKFEIYILIINFEYLFI